MRYGMRVPAMLAALVIGSACGDEPDAVAPVGPALMTTEGCQQTPGCWEGDEDPDPAAPGYWIGTTVTPESCYSASGAGINDADQDALDDTCEQRLADRFGPQLAYWSGDNVGREPHWVARPVGASKVWIMYLFSYYVDGGTEGYPCCNAGHYGDSEYVVLEVAYNGGNGHWVLRTAYYSQHTGYETYAPGFKGYPMALYYPDKKGGYPRVYVSGYKHANYSSQNACDNGGVVVIDPDWCAPNAFARVPAPASANIGSRYHHTPSQDCKASTHPVYATNGVIECYWTGSRFSGWQGAIPDSDAYSDRMWVFGF